MGIQKTLSLKTHLFQTSWPPPLSENKKSSRTPLVLNFLLPWLLPFCSHHLPLTVAPPFAAAPAPLFASQRLLFPCYPKEPPFSAKTAPHQTFPLLASPLSLSSLGQPLLSLPAQQLFLSPQQLQQPKTHGLHRQSQQHRPYRRSSSPHMAAPGQHSLLHNEANQTDENNSSPHSFISFNGLQQQSKHDRTHRTHQP